MAFVIAVSTPHNLFTVRPYFIDFLGGAAMMGLFIASLSIGSLPWWLSSSRRMSKQADAVLIYRLVQLIAAVEESPSEWHELPFRDNLLSRLDAIAILVQGDLRRAWRTRDPDLSQWLGDYTAAVASSMRDLGKWLITPRVDTRDHFLERLRDLLVCVARGDWDGIPRDLVPPTKPEERWFARPLRGVRILVTSVIPITILWLLTLLKVALAEPAKTYLYAGAFLWAAIAWIAALDPLYAVKIEAIKNLMSLAGSEKKKG
jgi:hypothetical protein